MLTPNPADKSRITVTGGSSPSVLLPGYSSSNTTVMASLLSNSIQSSTGVSSPQLTQSSLPIPDSSTVLSPSPVSHSSTFLSLPSIQNQNAVPIQTSEGTAILQHQSNHLQSKPVASSDQNLNNNQPMSAGRMVKDGQPLEMGTCEGKPASKLRDSVLRDKARSKNGKHLVLDLDETLVHSFDSGDRFHDFSGELTPEQQKRIYTIKFSDGDIVGYVRPYVEDFLEVAFDEFESVGVWSAGTKSYVEKIVELLFRGRPLKFVMSRDECNELQIDKGDIPCRFKPLENIYASHPTHNDKNTLIIDDRKDICSLNCMNNIQLPMFRLDSRSRSVALNDCTLLILAKWFRSDDFRKSKNVKEIKSRSPMKIQ